MNVEVLDDFKSSQGPTYSNVSYGLGYIAAIHEKLYLEPQLGLNIGETSINFHHNPPNFLKSAHDVPLDRDALLVQKSYYIRPQMILYYFPLPRNPIFFLSISAYSMYGFANSDWKYGYRVQSGKTSIDYMSKVNTIPVNSFDSSWAVMIGVGVGTFNL